MPAKIHRPVPRSKDRNRTSPLPLKSKKNLKSSMAGVGYWRQLEQPSRELSACEPEHEHADEPEQQHGVPACPEFRWRVVDT